MDEVRIVRHRTHIWPVLVALIVLALVIGYVFFAKGGPASQVGWNQDYVGQGLSALALARTT